MNTNKKIMENVLDVRIIIAVLWIAEVLSSLNGDTYRLSDPIALQAIIAKTVPIVTSPKLLLVMSCIFVVPILMSVLTLTLKYSASRISNRIISSLYALIMLAFWILGFVLHSKGYEFVWSSAQLIFTSLIVFYSWKMPKQEC
jgi:hypothetical protein